MYAIAHYMRIAYTRPLPQSAAARFLATKSRVLCVCVLHSNYQMNSIEYANMHTLCAGTRKQIAPGVFALLHVDISICLIKCGFVKRKVYFWHERECGSAVYYKIIF